LEKGNPEASDVCKTGLPKKSQAKKPTAQEENVEDRSCKAWRGKNKVT